VVERKAPTSSGTAARQTLCSVTPDNSERNGLRGALRTPFQAGSFGETERNDGYRLVTGQRDENVP
jgi:hypothetical protein